MALPEQAQSTPRASGKAGAIALGLIVGLAAGFGGGYYFGSEKAYRDSRAGTLAEVNKKLEDAGLVQTEGILSLPTQEVQGELLENQGDRLLIQFTFPQLNPLEDPSVRVYEARIDSETAFYRSTEKDPETFQAELDEWESLYGISELNPLGPGADAPPAPEPFARETITISDLRPGDIVSALSSEQLGDSSSFLATEIVVATVINPLENEFDPALGPPPEEPTQ